MGMHQITNDIEGKLEVSMKYSWKLDGYKLKVRHEENRKPGMVHNNKNEQLSCRALSISKQRNNMINDCNNSEEINLLVLA